MASRAAAKVSAVTVFTTIRAAGFFSRTRANISFSSPPLPPTKTWVGAGRSRRASGAAPSITVTLVTPRWRLFSSMRAQASFLRSMA